MYSLVIMVQLYNGLSINNLCCIINYSNLFAQRGQNLQKLQKYRIDLNDMLTKTTSGNLHFGMDLYCLGRNLNKIKTILIFREDVKIPFVVVKMFISSLQNTVIDLFRHYLLLFIFSCFGFHKARHGFT